jgi:hypothetical protein
MYCQEAINLNTLNTLSTTKSNLKATLRGSKTHIVTTIQNSSLQLYSSDSLQSNFSYSLPPNSEEITCAAIHYKNHIYCAQDKLRVFDIETNKSEVKEVF